ncbi:CO(2)-response secreted protease-like [Silene latifolia]|uniref:CO(2)-response secreted protease-like n=1 Tax=Silene latifolia TaxID=37657 RepID=UPI003D7853FA
MASYLLFISLSLLYFSTTMPSASPSSDKTPQNYIVYMGASRGIGGDMKVEEELGHLELLAAVIPSEEAERVSVGHVYEHAFRGFSALLTHAEASLLSENEEVISVFRDPMMKVHTTRSWEFLNEESGVPSDFQSQFPQPSTDVIIGMIDTGIWPESPSFSDKGMGEVPRRWKGTCMEGSDFKKSACNRKLIGARYYGYQDGLQKYSNTSASKSTSSPRDQDSHGTHTASIAAGAQVANASYFGLAKGTAKGGSSSARIAIYKACLLDTCSGSTILKAIDDAVKDGVDIISLSLGMDLLLQADFFSDPIAIGSFHANEMGVMVVCSAGNSGPDPYTVVNTAPWIFTIAASNIDRDFESTLVLGNKSSFKGTGITLSNLTTSSQYPLAFAGDVAAAFTPPSEASNCYPGSLDPEKAAGKIVVCVNNYPSIARRIKTLVVQDAGAKGMIYISDVGKGVPFDSGAYPFTQVGENDGIQILNYINSTKRSTATILSTVTVEKFKPAPVVADFSSRGPGGVTENILKPDIMAPGVAILAANIPQSQPIQVPAGKKPSKFAVKSGTSMACPHVSGAAAYIKSVHHEWTPSMIKSALMTTATIADNMGRFLRDSSDMASPHEIGAGEISPVKALDPGLVFPTGVNDYFNFLCYCGYSKKNLRSMSSTKFNCPKVSSDQLISNINYPSISIGGLKRNQTTSVTRHVINVGSSNATYTAVVRSPDGLRVNISPKKIIFKSGFTTASFNVTFHAKQARTGYNFGSITWFDGLRIVHVVYAVNIIV